MIAEVRQTKLAALLAPYMTETAMIEGNSYRVVDANRLFANKGRVEKYFSSAHRIEPVYMWLPKAGDPITETGRDTVAAEGNEIVFIKKLGSAFKIYVPSGTSGKLDAATLDTKYEAGVPVQEAAIAAILPDGAQIYRRVPKVLPIDILHECIKEPSVILAARGKDAKGKAKDQLLLPGDSLKFEDGDCLPLPKHEIAAAWQVTEKSLWR